MNVPSSLSSLGILHTLVNIFKKGGNLFLSNPSFISLLDRTVQVITSYSIYLF